MIDKTVAKTWTVLLVDDEPDSLEIVTRILRFNGATVHTALSGKAALDILAKLKPTFVIMDLSMPGMDGWEMLYSIKSTPKMQDVPVIALTAHAMKGDRERAVGAGFHYYFTKPLNPISFFDELLAFFARQQAEPLSSPAKGEAEGKPPPARPRTAGDR